MVSASDTKTADRFTATDALLLLGTAAWVEGTDLIEWFEDQWVFGAALVLLPVLAALLTVVIRLVIALVRRHWWRAGSVLAGVGAVVLAIIIFQSFGGTDRVRFEARRAYWDRLLIRPSAAGAPRIAAAPWRDRGGAGVVNTIDYLVYDETDEIARPDASRSSRWKRLASDQPLVRDFEAREREAPDATSVRRVVGHYYIAEEVYP